MNKYGLLKNLVIFLVVFLFIASVFSLYNVSDKKEEAIDIQKMVEQIEQRKVQKIIVEGDILKLTLHDGTEQKLKKESNESLSELLGNFNLDSEAMKSFSIEVKEQSGFGYWMSSLLPFLIPFLLFEEMTLDIYSDFKPVFDPILLFLVLCKKIPFR